MEQVPRQTTRTSRSSGYAIGVDPGKEGAAVVLLGRSAVAAACWKQVKRQRKSVFEFKLATPEQLVSVEYLPRASAVGQSLCQFLRAFSIGESLLACEDIFFSKNVRSAVSLARTAGEVVGVLENHLDTKSEWVMAGEWRYDILGLARNTKREIAKAASLKLLPARVKLLDQILDRVGKLDHVTDAAGVAAWVQAQETSRNNEHVYNSRVF